jgi:hypothetical protein
MHSTLAFDSEKKHTNVLVHVTPVLDNVKSTYGKWPFCMLWSDCVCCCTRKHVVYDRAYYHNNWVDLFGIWCYWWTSWYILYTMGLHVLRTKIRQHQWVIKLTSLRNTPKLTTRWFPSCVIRHQLGVLDPLGEIELTPSRFVVRLTWTTVMHFWRC